MELKILLEEQEEGGYTVHVPALPGCISEGDTLDPEKSSFNPLCFNSEIKTLIFLPVKN